MTQVLDLAQPYLDASSYEESGMFPDVQNYDFFPCAEGEENCSRPKLVDNPEEFHPASDQVFYDLSPAEMQFTEMLHPTGQKTAHESSIETLPLMVPETQQNLAEDIFKSFPCLKDALATSAKCAPVKTSSRRKRGRKLWEFLLDLLENPECNPSIIRWEDKSNGVFRLKEQEIIARKWGQRREKKDNLSYDYFARALRYHYKSRMLVSVPERKLVYKFGPKVLSEMK
ncbi:hypothetical protein HAZT_HAZT000215 [Hyalella azteca]|uniref:ETS domain-containing protein n=1 Tax=Hyalella azteca TaxID=294128 RepID=A0A6A0H082_HYAAZ|nr:hypothetical protein HAZT_HAZT000215 [Hyalella azteca]